LRIRAGHHAVVDQAADLGGAEAEVPGKHGLGVLAEPRCAANRDATTGGEVQR
jgi:hypothetical protein